MLATLEILLPVFGLIFAGFACRRRNVLGPNSASELNRFVVWLALPALLFDTMAHATWQQLYQPAFVATFSIACVSVFVPDSGDADDRAAGISPTRASMRLRRRIRTPATSAFRSA